MPCPAQPRERYIANIGPRPQRAPCTYACPAVKHREMSTATASNVAPWALWIEHAQREPTSVRMSNVRNTEVVVIEINAHVPCVDADNDATLAVDKAHADVDVHREQHNASDAYPIDFQDVLVGWEVGLVATRAAAARQLDDVPRPTRWCTSASRAAL